MLSDSRPKFHGHASHAAIPTPPQLGSAVHSMRPLRACRSRSLSPAAGRSRCLKLDDRQCGRRQSLGRIAAACAHVDSHPRQTTGRLINLPLLPSCDRRRFLRSARSSRRIETTPPLSIATQIDTPARPAVPKQSASTAFHLPADRRRRYRRLCSIVSGWASDHIVEKRASRKPPPPASRHNCWYAPAIRKCAPTAFHGQYCAAYDQSQLSCASLA